MFKKSIFTKLKFKAKVNLTSDNESREIAPCPSDSGGSIVQAKNGEGLNPLDNNSADLKTSDFQSRLKAAAIDHVILLLITVVPGLVMGLAILYMMIDASYSPTNDTLMFEGSILAICAGASYAVPFVYYIWFESSALQATPGKLLSGIRSIDRKTGGKLNFLRALWKGSLQYLLLMVCCIVASIFTSIVIRYEHTFTETFKFYFIATIVLDCFLAAFVFCKPIFSDGTVTLLDKLTGRLVVPIAVAQSVQSNAGNSLDSSSKEGTSKWKSVLKFVLILLGRVLDFAIASILILLFIDSAGLSTLGLLLLYFVVRIIFRKQIERAYGKFFYYATPLVMLCTCFTGLYLSIDFFNRYEARTKPEYALLDKGIQAEKKGDLKRAKAIYAQVKKNKIIDSASPIVSKTRDELLWLLLPVARPDDEKYYERVIALSDEDTTTVAGKARAYSFWGQNKRAKRLMRQAIAAESDQDKKASLEKELAQLIEKEKNDESSIDFVE